MDGDDMTPSALALDLAPRRLIEHPGRDTHALGRCPLHDRSEGMVQVTVLRLAALVPQEPATRLLTNQKLAACDEIADPILGHWRSSVCR